MTSVDSMPVPFVGTGPVPFPSSRSTASTSRTSSAKPPTRASQANQAKSAKGPNSNHRKEQNRIASKNYREKRKQKLALLRQILDEPADGASTDAGVDVSEASDANDVQAGSVGVAPVTTSDGASLGLGSLPTGLPSAYMTALSDSLPVVFPGFNGDFQPGMLSDMLHTGTNALEVPSVHSNLAASPPQPPTALNTTTASSTWTAADSTSHPSNPFTWMPSEPLLHPTSTGTDGTDSTILSAAELSALNIPLLNPWTVPFSSDLSSPLAQTSSPSAPLTSLTSPSSSTPSSNISSENRYGNDILFGSAAETLQLGETFDPALDFSQMMRSELSAASLFAGVQTQMPATNTPTTSNSNSFSKSPLPSRPSPRVLLASLAQSGNNTGTYSTASSNHGEPPPTLNSTATTSSLPGPSRRARKKNKPVVRAMLQYVQTLSSHQKRLILQTLLDEGEGAGVPGAGADERVEEVQENDGGEDMEEDDDYGNHSPGSSHVSASTTPSSTDADATALQFLRHNRRRQVADRWNTSTKEKALASATAAYTNISIGALGGGDDYPASFSSGFGSGFGTTSAKGRAHLPPTFMTMTLQCRRLTFCIAILQNCEACGLPNPAAMLEESSQYEDVDGNTAEDLQSPFALAADEARAVAVQGPARIAAVVAAVRQNLEKNGKTPPRDLQPVDAQILVAHHPYIDTIPFRGFRARALALLAEMEAAEEVAAAAQQSANLLYSSDAGAATPGMNASGVASGTPCLLDEDELCYDMNVADGMICWGSQIGNGGTGVSSQAMRDSASSRDMRAGVPWDMRSWEPQVWFLKKYWFLVGGWDDDMWRNCRWWHSMRGEDLDYSVFAAPGY
ncbi:hypothetical protein F503_02463 [Ophiostoma piceae UAMH 11346]|uniref:BZIP domain-containing protein n=1 Tax=Ophiostoma piceae (strain UAMH 11346) TaxID=1262450 RepID=S3CZF9_OPHP1|nr:hypothetical protein F503_02463 [Ophiostoma piceae UAMH 11346]